MTINDLHLFPRFVILVLMAAGWVTEEHEAVLSKHHDAFRNAKSEASRNDVLNLVKMGLRGPSGKKGLPKKLAKARGIWDLPGSSDILFRLFLNGMMRKTV